MDIEGRRRSRTVYRRPYLTIESRRLQHPPLRPSQTTSCLENFVIRDVVVRETITTEVRTVSEVPQPVESVANEQEPATQAESEVTKKMKRPRFARMMYASAALVFAVGGLLAYQAFMANTAVDIQIKKIQNASADDTSGSSSLPTDVKPTDPNYIQNYKVAPTLPQLLTIKKIGVNARILQVSVDKDNRMEVPKTAYDVAWYNGSSRPGENGAMVIDGHVQGVGGPAIFSDLKKLNTGDVVAVTRGDGKVFNYTVAKTETVAVSDLDMGKLLVSADTAKPGLNLITCAGAYDRNADEFNSRMVVYTIQQ